MTSATQNARPETPIKEVERTLQPMISFRDPLREEIETYEQMRRGDLSVLHDLNSIGRWLIGARIAKDWSLSQLANALDVSVQQVSRDEQNEYDEASPAHSRRARRSVRAGGSTITHRERPEKESLQHFAFSRLGQTSQQMDNQSPSGNSSPQEGKEEEKRTLDVHFDRSPSYQLHHVDGAHGGIAPNGEHLVFDLYVERTPNPKLIRHEVEVEDQADLPDGAISLGDEISRGGREGVLRESECGVVMSWGAVLRLHNWLGEKIEEAKDAGILEKDEPQNADD